VYIESLKIENFRTFEAAEIHFNLPGQRPASDSSLPNVSLLLGDNGAGKTSVLRAAVLAALGPILTSGSAGYVPYSLVRRAGRHSPGPARVSVELLLHAQDGHPGKERLETVIERTRGWVDRFQPKDVPAWTEALWEEKSPAFLMVGYGASRRVDPNAGFSEELRSKSRALRYARVAGLFEEAVTMIPLSSWLPRFAAQNPGRGVVLIDEVDLHLHPEWQQQVIPTLARALPNLQFVLTSHSPLVVGTLRGANVFVLETELADGVRRTLLRPSDEEVYGLSSDQILTSGHFRAPVLQLT